MLIGSVNNGSAPCHKNFGTIPTIQNINSYTIPLKGDLSYIFGKSFMIPDRECLKWNFSLCQFLDSSFCLPSTSLPMKDSDLARFWLRFT